MTRLLFGLAGIAFAYVLLKYREAVGDMIGDAEWMRKIGGVYNLVIVTATLVFFWSVAYLTGTEDILFAPLKFLIPGLIKNQAAPLI